MLLGKNADYLYYEGDVFCTFANPFINPNTENLVKTFMTQKPLKV